MTNPPPRIQKRDLTPKQRRFAELVLKGQTAANAYRIAYNSSGTPATCGRTGHSMLKHPKIASILGRANTEVAIRSENVIKKYAISKERVLEELARLAFADMRNVAGWDGKKVILRESDALTDSEAAAVLEVYQSKSGVRVKLADKRAALVDLGRHLGLFNADQANAPVANLYNVVIK